ncbi:MAG: C_GCAxxG_C_C family protein [Dehalococcoidia bacterium]|nr:MAG: C_GCAxxG_C_C family protein [Dehalococcoidia bacterium]
MTKVKVREKYRGLSRQELLDKAYELGFNFEKNSFSCSQSTVAAIHELLEMDDVVVKVATSLSGGTAEQFSGTCGPLAGGLIVLGYFFGRPVEKLSYQECTKDNVDALLASLPITQLLADKFVKEYGTIICPYIQRRLFGRTWWLRDPEELEKFEAAGGHSAPDKCSHVTGTGARWAMEILLDKGAVEL